MKKILLFTLLVCITFFAFSMGESINPQEKGTGMIYGNINAPDGLNGLTVYSYDDVNVEGPFMSPPKATTFENGNFIVENIKPGRYYIPYFVSGGEQYFLTTGMSAAQLRRKVFIVKSSGVHFVGCLKITKKPGVLFFDSGQFYIKKAYTPGRKTILRHLIKQAKGTGWDKRMKRYL